MAATIGKSGVDNPDPIFKLIEILFLFNEIHHFLIPNDVRIDFVIDFVLELRSKNVDKFFRISLVMVFESCDEGVEILNRWQLKCLSHMIQTLFLTLRGDEPHDEKSKLAISDDLGGNTPCDVVQHFQCFEIRLC